jgi:creatinine amidohydrolase
MAIGASAHPKGACVPQTVFLDEMTDPEVTAHLQRDDLLLIPTGATEQHGPHGPLGTDVIIPREVCRRVAIRLGALVAPPVPYGISAGHRGFHGLSYLRPSTFMAVIGDLIASFSEAGFRRLVFVNGHYTNFPAINLAAMEAADRCRDGTHAWAMSYWDALPPDQAEEYLSMSTGLHANIGETAAVMATRPELVRLDRAIEGWPNLPDMQGPPMPLVFAYYETRPASTYRSWPGGVWGDPRGANAELGRRFLEQITDAVCRVIADVDAAERQMDVDEPGSRPLES